MGLNDTAIRNLKPQPAPYKKSDGEGLYLLVTPGGSKLWQLADRFAGKQKTIALGQYPAVAPAMAREAKLEAERVLAQGVGPSEKRRADKRAAVRIIRRYRLAGRQALALNIFLATRSVPRLSISTWI
jgi:hypothetical protein